MFKRLLNLFTSQQVVHPKIGFHTAVGGNPTGIGDHLQALDAAKIPFFIKAVDGMTGLYDAQLIMRQSQVKHTAVYRRSVRYDGCAPIENPDVPDYNLPPKEAAAKHWAWHKAGLPPELDRQLIWIETINEVRKEAPWGDWLGEFATETALLMNAEGYKFAAFGFSSGTPDPESWETPGMLRYLRYCEQHPAVAAVALHEYSFKTNDIWYLRGDHIGRFEKLFSTCDKHGIKRPKVLITEWGWTLDNVPAVETAVADVKAVAEYYSRFPEILGAAIWYLGPGFGGIANKVQPLIAPLIKMTIETTFPAPAVGEPVEPPPTKTLRQQLWDKLIEEQETSGVRLNKDTALQQAINAMGLNIVTNEVYVGAVAGQKAEKLDGSIPPTAFMWDSVTGQVVSFTDPYLDVPPPLPPPVDTPFTLTHWPTEFYVVTQHFGARPDYYAQFNLPGHEGIDIRAYSGSMVFAAAPGKVFSVESDPDKHNYGIHVRIEHADGYQTIYGHLQESRVAVGDMVQGGQLIGLADNTGNSQGSHLHLTMKHPDGQAGWLYNIIDPTPFLRPLAPDLFPESMPEPAPVGTVGIGLHASADPGELHGGTAEFQEFKALRPDVIKVLSAHSASAIERLASDQKSIGNSPQWIIRAFLSGWDRIVSSQNFFNWTYTDVLRAINTLAPKYTTLDNIWLELHNEPNLVIEGWKTNWQNGAEFGSWLLSVMSLYRKALPDVRLVYPGLSPGGDVPGVRYDSGRFLQESIVAVTSADAVGLHCYWVSQADMQTTLASVDSYCAKFPSKPLWVTEASRKRPSPQDAAPIPEQMAVDYVKFYQELRKRPQVRGVTYFVASASNPEFGPEAWIVNGKSRSIAQMVRVSA